MIIDIQLSSVDNKDMKDKDKLDSSILKKRDHNLLSNYIKRESTIGSTQNSAVKSKQPQSFKLNSQLNTPKSFIHYEQLYPSNRLHDNQENIRKLSANKYNNDKKKFSNPCVINDHFALDNDHQFARKNIENYINIRQKSKEEVNKPMKKRHLYSNSISFNVKPRIDSTRKKDTDLSPRIEAVGYYGGRKLEAHHLYNKLLGLLNSNEQQIAKINNSSLHNKDENFEKSSFGQGILSL